MSTPRYPTPDAVETAYYQAFQAADPEAMMDLWAEDAEVTCIHPLGGRPLAGPAAVLEGWLNLFARELDIRVTLHNVRRIQCGDLAVHTGEEHVVRAGDGGLAGINNVTNVFRRTAAGWKMVLHHASAGPALTSSRPADIVARALGKPGTGMH